MQPRACSSRSSTSRGDRGSTRRPARRIAAQRRQRSRGKQSINQHQRCGGGGALTPSRICVYLRLMRAPAGFGLGLREAVFVARAREARARFGRGAMGRGGGLAAGTAGVVSPTRASASALRFPSTQLASRWKSSILMHTRVSCASSPVCVMWVKEKYWDAGPRWAYSTGFATGGWNVKGKTASCSSTWGYSHPFYCPSSQRYSWTCLAFPLPVPIDRVRA